MILKSKKGRVATWSLAEHDRLKNDYVKIFTNCSRAHVSQFFSQKVLRELWIKLYEGITKEVLFERCN